MENSLRSKLQNNYNNVRKAFLDLDKNHNGSISAEELAKILKYGVKQQDPNKQELDLDYSLLEYHRLWFFHFPVWRTSFRVG